MNTRKAILVVSFGSSVQKARETGILPIEDLIRSTFLDYEVSRAFTSTMVINKLKRTIGLSVDTPEEGLQKLIEKGIKEIIVQPLHIIPGVEFGKIKDSIKKFKQKDVNIKLGKPLLYDEDDYLKVINALKTQLPLDKKEQVILLVGHGTYHQANRYYENLQRHIYDKNLPIIVGTIEEGISSIPEKLVAEGYKEVVIMPFMLVAGDHVINDLFGEGDSWKNELIHKGVLVKSYEKGLGENPAFRELYLNRVKENRI